MFGKLTVSWLQLFAGMGLRVVAQALVFVIVARVLGVDAYGALVTTTALAMMLAGFSGFGTQILLVRDVAKSHQNFPFAYGYALTAIVAGFPLLFILYLGFGWVVLPQGIPVDVVLLVGVTELLFTPLSILGASCYQAHERMGRAARMILVPAVFRLVSAVLLLAGAACCLAADLLRQWVLYNALASLVAAVYIYWHVARELEGAVRLPLSVVFSRIKEGIPFSFRGLAERLYVDMDKVMVGRMVNLETAGFYAAGYRIVDMSFLPLYSLLNAASPELFRAGTEGVQTAWRYALSILGLPLVYAVVAGTLLFACAPLMPILLGQEFSDASHVLRGLAGLPVIVVFRLFLQYTLGSSGYQRGVVGVFFIGSMSNIILNLLLIPYWGWRGAVMSTYLSEFVFALGLVLFLRRRILA
ncbi:oligosaccharide flippase family protein [Thiolapillus brandeum]|uniref:Polysaccharide biosynthesis protein n=1 Tax=Thiolapillus brandeum TaxID=1076588 RepID=A0A7U6JHB5_9GAMM|nr:oligosaccharide flippase family protein [Thiolapillus brandeum]BAO43523.1 polysaccharide biosynthesis protein [Thiolapillus brandeum]